jgi:hypothetical protein
MDSNLQHHIHDMDLVVFGLTKIIADCKDLRKSVRQCVRDLEQDANELEGLRAVKIEESCSAASPTDVVSSLGHADITNGHEDEMQPAYWHLFKL